MREVSHRLSPVAPQRHLGDVVTPVELRNEPTVMPGRISPWEKVPVRPSPKTAIDRPRRIDKQALSSLQILIATICGVPLIAGIARHNGQLGRNCKRL
jgi:hypothetical protein